MVSDIGLMHNMKSNIFEKARIKLTLYYIGIMAVILFTFSSALIFTIESRVRHGFRDRIIIRMEDNDPVQDTLDEIKMLIYMIDGVLLTAIGISSYFLAGVTLAPIKRALEAQKKFSADASHDLRTPLAIMTTETEVSLLNKNASTLDLRETLESNLEEIHKMSKLVHDLLLISRGDNQATVHSYSKVDIHAFLSKIIDKLNIQSSEKGLAVNISEYEKIVSKIDVNNFERAITNIIQNSIKYTKKGSVYIDLSKNENKLSIVITDTGVGISEKDLPHVFDRFYKAEHSRSDNTGSGLGLPIAKLIVEEHGGEILLTSKINEGTRVHISMPIVS